MPSRLPLILSLSKDAPLVMQATAPRRAAMTEILPDLPMADEDFAFIAKLIKKCAGISLGPQKRNMVYARLSHRLRQLRLKNFGEYRAYLESTAGESEIGILVNALTTNYTKFFRESHHFDHLAEEFIPAIVRKGHATGRRRLRIWSAGCASGEEPYSIAMTLRQGFPDLDQWEAYVLATDIDTNALDEGVAGVYAGKQVEDIPELLRAKYMRPAAGDRFRVSGRLRSLTAFKWLNLIEDWPMKGPFDAIFCRNVIIYFDRHTQESVVKRFTNLLAVGGILYLGHSESPIWGSGPLKLVGRSIYQKTA